MTRTYCDYCNREVGYSQMLFLPVEGVSSVLSFIGNKNAMQILCEPCAGELRKILYKWFNDRKVQ